MGAAVLLVLSFVVAVLSSADPGTAFICPKGIRSFSSGPGNNFYYVCNDVGDEPVLTNCTTGKIYWPYKEGCFSERLVRLSANQTIDESNVKTFKQLVLGRDVYLGDFYNERDNEIMTGFSLWKQKTVEENKERRPSRRSTVTVFGEQSDRLEHVGISDTLKMEYLSDMIAVSEGTKAYLMDYIHPEKAVASILTYHATTHAEVLPISTPSDYNVCALMQNQATHVVTEVRHGMVAMFVFKKQLMGNESSADVIDKLTIAVKAVPATEIDQEGKLIISKSIRDLVKDVDIEVFGDFELNRQPSSYAKSIHLYNTLPSYLGVAPEYANAANIEITLTPIAWFCGLKTPFTRISNTIINCISTMLTELEMTKMTASTLAMADCVRRYAPLKNILIGFLTQLSRLQHSIKSDLQRLVPQIRRGEGSRSEAELIELLTKYRISPFHHENAERFLGNRRREITMVDYVLGRRGNNVRVLKYTEAIDDKILFSKREVMMLKFNIITDESIINRFLSGEKIDEQRSWFNCPKVIALMGEQFERFITFAASNIKTERRGYLFAISDAKNTTINLYAQQHGEILSDNFAIPASPQRMHVVSRAHDALTFSTTKPNNTWINAISIKHWTLGEEKSAKTNTYRFTTTNVSYAEVRDLQANVEYFFSAQYVTAMGSSLSGEKISVTTRPCSMPVHLRKEGVSMDSFTILWDAPYHQAEKITTYRVEVVGVEFDLVKVVNNTHARIANLQPALKYHVSVTAVFQASKKDDEESLPALLQVTTRPHAPTSIIVAHISLHSVTLTWTADRVAAGASIVGYRVKYVTVDNVGSAIRGGTEMGQSTGNETFVTLKDLLQDTTYAASVKVLTTLGNSDYSSPLMFRTPFNETQLEILRKSLEDMIKKSAVEVTQQTKKELQEERKTTEKEINMKTDLLKEEIKNGMTAVNDSIEKTNGKVENNRIDLNEKISDLRQEVNTMTFTYPPHGIARWTWSPNPLITSEQKLRTGNLLTTITMEKEYIVRFSFKPQDTTFGNIICFDLGGGFGGDGGPCMFWENGVQGRKVDMYSYIDGSETSVYPSFEINLNEWVDAEVKQELVSGKYVHTYILDGKLVRSVINNNARVIPHVRVFASTSRWTAAHGFIRNFVLYNRRKGSGEGRYYYPEYKASFVGYGKQLNSTDVDKKQGEYHLHGCIEKCHEKRKSEKAWDGVRYEYRSKICYCLKEQYGHVETESDLHFKFM